jgi:hypothetical protein
MSEKIERIVGASFGFGGAFSLYLYLKLSGKIPGPGWWIINAIDYYLVKAFHILKIILPIFIIAALVIMYLKKVRDRKEYLWQEQRREEKAHEMYLQEQPRKEEIIFARLGNIENAVKRIDDELLLLNRSSSEVTESVLEDFL